MKFRLIEEKENKKTLDLDEALGIKESKETQPRLPIKEVVMGDDFKCSICGNTSYNYGFETCDKKGNLMEPSTESDWDGTYRCEKCGQIYKNIEKVDESLNESRPRTRKEIVVLQGNYGYGWDDLIEYELTGDVDKDTEIYKEIRQDKKDYAENEPQYSHRTIHRFEKIEKVEESFNKVDYTELSNPEFLELAHKCGIKTIEDLTDYVKRYGKDKDIITSMKEYIKDFGPVEESCKNTNESLKEYYDPTETITDYFDEYEQKNYGIDEEGYTKDGLEQYVHCGWCEEPTPLSEMKKEVNLGYICKDCQDALYSRGEKAVYEEAIEKKEDNSEELPPKPLYLGDESDYEVAEDELKEKLIQGKSDTTLKKNIKTEIEAGKDPKQAYAIAKSIQKKNESFEDEHLGEVVKDDEVVDYFDNSVHDEDIVEDDFNMSDEDIKKLSEIAVVESKKNVKEVANTLTENKVDTTPTQELINESVSSNEEVALDYVSPNAVDANFQAQEVDLNNI